jgi:hypothetical protein
MKYLLLIPVGLLLYEVSIKLYVYLAADYIEKKLCLEAANIVRINRMPRLANVYLGICRMKPELRQVTTEIAIRMWLETIFHMAKSRGQDPDRAVYEMMALLRRRF